MNVNTVVLVGRAGQNPEIKYFESGKAMATFNLAVDRGKQAPDAETQTDWFRIELWGRQAEVAYEYIKKGSLVGIRGKLEFKQWQDSSGQTQENPYIRNISLRLLGSKNDIAPPMEDSPDLNGL